MPSPKVIGIAVVLVAAAMGYVPGVPAFIGAEPPAEDEADAEEIALPPAPDVVEVDTSEPVGPDDGLIRVIVTPTGDAVSIDPNDATAETSDDPSDADAAQPTVGTTVDAEAESATRDELDPGQPADPGGDDTASVTSTPVDGSNLGSLTDGAVLEVDADGTRWAVWPDGTRVPLSPSTLPTEPSPEAAPPAEPTATEPTPSPSPPESAGDVATGPLGHPTMDAIASLDDVESVTPLGDGSFAVALRQPDALDDLPVDVLEDAPMGITTEPYEGYQWALDNNGDNLANVGGGPAQRPDADVDGPEALPMATGRGIVVAVVDSGVDFSHPDLAASRWANVDEQCNNGVDDDGNGYVDDCHGWDFGYEDPTPYNPGAHPHGTHVAGIIAAARNGNGVAGVAPEATIMDLNVGITTRSGEPGITSSAVARAIRYAVDNGADVINLSLGTSPGSPREGSASVENAIAHAEASGVVVVAAAGNDGTNLDGAPAWPASYENPNLITVGASDPTDARASFSNWGRVVDVFAPGVLILSTVPESNGGYVFMSGTSQATPLVAGIVALMLEHDPSLNATRAASRVATTADRQQTLVSFVADGVRANAANAVGASDPVHVIDDVAISASGLWGATDDQPVRVDLDIAVPRDGDFDADHRWLASFIHGGSDGRHVLVDLPVSVNGQPATTDDRGDVDLGVSGSGTATIDVALPAGDYTLVLEAVAAGDQRLGDPAVVAFSVADADAPANEVGQPVSGESPPESGADDSPSTSPGDGGADAAPPSDTGPTPTPAPTSPGESPAPSDPSATDPAGSDTSGGAAAGGDTSAGGSTTTPADTGGSPGTDPGPGDTGSTTGNGSSSGGSTDASSPDPGPATPDGSSPPPSSGSGTSTPTDTSSPDSGGEPSSPPPPGSGPVIEGEWEVRGVFPAEGPVGVSQLVQLTGSFPEWAYVWFGEAPGTVLWQSQREIIVLTPPTATAGPVDVSLRLAGVGTAVTVPNGYTFVALGSPTTPVPSQPSFPTNPDEGTSTGGSTTAPTTPTTGDPGGGATTSPPTTGDEPTAGPPPATEPPPSGDAPPTDDTNPQPAAPTPTPASPGASDPGDTNPPAGNDEGGQTDGSGAGGRATLSEERTDLGNGLSGRRIIGDDPGLGAPSCTSEPCPLG